MKKKTLINLLLTLFIFQAQAQTKVSLNCSMKDDAKIFSKPDASSIDRDMTEGLGSSWSFDADSQITNSKGVFYSGKLIDGRGNTMDGKYYILKSEWDCIKNSFGSDEIVEPKRPKPYTLTAYKMYDCGNKRLDINNLNYLNSQSRIRNYTITVKENSIKIKDLKLNVDFDYTPLKYDKVKDFDHYVVSDSDYLTEIYINKTKKLLIFRAVTGNGRNDGYEVYLLK